MEFETYEEVIDSYNSGVGVEAGETLTDYIKRNNIKIKEIQMDPIGDFEKILKEFIRKRKRKPRSIEEIKEFYFQEMGTASEGPGNRDNASMMASYEPGKYSSDEIDMYEQYKYDMNEQRPGMPIMEIDDFLRIEYGQARADVASGGLPAILGV